MYVEWPDKQEMSTKQSIYSDNRFYIYAGEGSNPSHSAKRSSKQAGLLDFSFLLFCLKWTQNYGKNSSFFGKNKAIFGILAYSNRKNQFFPPSSEISLHLLPKFTDSGSAIPLTIAFAEDSFEV